MSSAASSPTIFRSSGLTQRDPRRGRSRIMPAGRCAHCREGHPNLCPECGIHRRAALPWRDDRTALGAEAVGGRHPGDFHRDRRGHARAARRRDPRGRPREAAPDGAGRAPRLRPDRAPDPAGAPRQRRRRDPGRRPAARTAARPLADWARHRIGAHRLPRSPAWTAGEGAPLVIEATNSPDGLRDAVSRRTDRRARGSRRHSGRRTATRSRPRKRGGARSTSSSPGAWARSIRQAIALLASGKVDVASLVTHTFALDEAPEAFRRHAENAPGMLKSIIVPNAMPAGRPEGGGQSARLIRPG